MLVLPMNQRTKYSQGNQSSRKKYSSPTHIKSGNETKNTCLKMMSIIGNVGN